ncbi:MAG: DUF739 family protein [Lachnospiraceae bacterium]|nr:DUF739 family protein [Lachnospiraceae bacterium]
MYSYNKLKGRIVELYGTQVNFAKKLGISKNSISKKLTGKTEFSQSDIEKWAVLLDIERGEYEEYFFT